MICQATTLVQGVLGTLIIDSDGTVLDHELQVFTMHTQPLILCANVLCVDNHVMEAGQD